jgi:peptide methionine sulfoxide reductase MsrA
MRVLPFQRYSTRHAVLTISATPAAAEITPVYFGNGCFWGRQKDFIDTEMKLGRDASSSTAVVGYAGGQENGKDVCYYYNAPGTLYERQGHAEVVQVSTLRSCYGLN